MMPDDTRHVSLQVFKFVFPDPHRYAEDIILSDKTEDET